MGTRGQIRVVAEEKRQKTYDNQYVLRGMMWARNYWLFCDNRVRLVSMVNDIIEELLDLDMEPKLESLWWTSTHHAEEKETSKQRPRVGSLLYRMAKGLRVQIERLCKRHGQLVAR